MDLRASTVFIVAAIDFAIAAIFYMQPRRDSSRAAYALFALVVALWGLGVGLFLWAENPKVLDLSARLLYFAGGAIAPAFYYFTLIFASDKLPGAGRKMFLIVPAAAFFFLYFFTDMIIGGFKDYGGQRGFSAGPFRLLFDANLWGFMALSLFELFRKYRSVASRTLKTQIILVSFGTYTVLGIAGITNVVNPLIFDFKWLWVGPVATIIWVAIVAYALLRHQLLNARIITTELFVSLIWLASVVETALSQSSSELIRKFLILVLGVGFFGYFLIRSVLKEVSSREEIERLARDLERANIELKRLDRAKSEFISIASHQLRTPLSIIKGYISMIREGSYGKVSPEIGTTMNKVYLSNERLIKLVNDLLDLSRMESGRMKYEFAEMDLKALVDSIVDEFQLPAGDKGIKIGRAPSQSSGFPKVFGDAWKLRQVIFNLIDNSLKYTNTGSIEIKLEKEDDSLKLSVKDSGIGMSQETADAVFHKFVRGGKDASRANAGGTGLGLYIAKRIVDDHKGEIWAESEGEGKGSTFFVTLPITNHYEYTNKFNENKHN